MKVLSHPVKLIERIEIGISINFISSLFKLLLILVIALLVFLLTSSTNLGSAFGDNHDIPPTTWQSDPPAPY